MADFPLFGGTKNIVSGSTTVNATGTKITSSVTTHTKGAYVELLSAANNTEGSGIIELMQMGDLQSFAVLLLDIAIGGAGSETVIIPNISLVTNNSYTGVGVLKFPINIPSGVRISARCQSNISAAAVTVSVRRGISSFKQGSSLSKVTTYGANETTSIGVLVAPLDDAYGSWVEITSSTTNESKALAVSAVRNPVSLANGTIIFQIGVGSAGNEEVIVDDMQVATNVAEVITGNMHGAFLVDVKEGERLSIRAAALDTNADFFFSYVIYGVS